jgi:hypothetical protein
VHAPAGHGREGLAEIPRLAHFVHRVSTLRSLAARVSTAMREAAGTASLIRLRRLALSSGLLSVTPVALPPGRARLVTRPPPSGSDTAPKTMGMLLVVFLAAVEAGVP